MLCLSKRHILSVRLARPCQDGNMPCCLAVGTNEAVALVHLTFSEDGMVASEKHHKLMHQAPVLRLHVAFDYTAPICTLSDRYDWIYKTSTFVVNLTFGAKVTGGTHGDLLLQQTGLWLLLTVQTTLQATQQRQMWLPGQISHVQLSVTEPICA